LLIEATRLPGVVIVTPNRFGDARGHFSEVWNRDTLRGHDIDIEFVQDNQSLSRDVGVVRGLHCQAPPRAQDKLVRVAQGAIFDVAVDVRRCSETYGQWVGVELSAENGRQLLVPKGFLHGFVTRAPDTLVIYKCSDSYAPDTERPVFWADPNLAIDWGIDPAQAILSAKDAEAPAFAAFETPFDEQELI